jgi:CheY-like chemotaxis protein
VRVLVVDDSADVRFMLRVLIEDAGMEVEEASSGEEALERLEDPSGLDAVVLDQRMPGLTGLDVAREVVDDPMCPPIVLFSAYLHPMLTEDAHDLGLITVVKTDLAALIGVLQDLGAVLA